MSDDQYHMMRMGGMSPAGFRIPERESSPELSDTDRMPFGKYKGVAMQDVPASYLHFLWSTGKKHDKGCPVSDYIRRNLDALKKEHKDGIW